MRVMVDTNVFISALLIPGSVPDLVLFDVYQNHELVLCNRIISEIHEVARRRFPQKVAVMDDLFATLRYDLVPETITVNVQMTDIKDQPILNAAINANVDLLITGDQHFLSLKPKIITVVTPSEYKNRYLKDRYSKLED
jgi:putative PIN family toxin of toxin-antitoxin system